MAYNDASDQSLPTSVKLLVAGGFGVGKTTFIGSVSEIEPLTTEEIITEASADTDNLDLVADKTTTTVAFDFGRISLNTGLMLYLFGTPGQDRFWFIWDELAMGALGAVVLVDTRRLADCFPVVDYFENRGIKFLVAVNEFDGAHRYESSEIRTALDLKPHVPVVRCDAREARSATLALVTLVQHLLALSPAS